ncbi:MAG: alpha/beta hydrolase [Gemmatimonadaceae bacterium]
MSCIPDPLESGFTTTTDVPLYWCRYGRVGRPRLLVLHGGPGASHDYLLPQMLELADAYELLFYDQRGGGRSRTDDPAPITWRTHAADLARVVRELGLKPLSLIGYSFGGLLALLYTVESVHGTTPDADRPARLVLIDPAPVNREYRRAFEAEFARRQASPAWHALREALLASGLRERDPAAYKQRLFELGVAGYFAHPERAHDLTPFRVIGKVQQSVWESLGDYDLTPSLRDVRVPTLIVHGAEDPIPVGSSRAIAGAMPSAELVTIDDCGHVPYVEQPVPLFGAIRRFLAAGDPKPLS